MPRPIGLARLCVQSPVWRRNSQTANVIIGMMNVHAKDLVIASIPTVSATALGQINQVLGIIGTLLGIAYLVWKWSREASR